MITTFELYGVSVSLYHLFWLLGIVIAHVIAISVNGYFGFSKARSILYTSLGLVLGYLTMLGMSWLSGGGKMNGQNFVRTVSVAPLYIFMLARLFSDPFWKVADFLAPIGIILTGVAHFGCIFSGCCHGYPSEWGIYSNVAGAVCFPIQPIEAAASILIGIILLLMAKYNIAKGKIYAWYMVIFGGTRFVLEFFRNNKKIWGDVSELALHALVAMILGLITITVTNKIYTRKQTHEETQV